MNPEKRFSFKNITVFPLGKIISGLRLKEGDNMPVMNLCERYEAALKAGKHAFQLCEQFTGELSNIANTEVLRSVVKRCNKILKENERDLANMKAVQSLYESNLSYIAENIEQKLSVYLTDKSEKNRNDLHEAMSVFAGNKMVNSVLENLSYDEYETKHGKELRNLKAVSVKEEKTYTEEEVNQLISERMKEIENKQPEKTGSGSFREIDTHIELNSTIKKILENCGTNKKLAVFCMNYYNELNRGISEEALYESFISGISNWNYMPAVETEISAMRSRTEKYKQEIDLKKILEAMAQTGSYYIVPLIEECVLDYVNAKTLQNKAILKQRLVPFEFDPFVRDIENILVYDLSIPNTVYLGESVEKKNGYVHTDMVFSPVLYVKENESVFNVRGMYYVKKGNSISRLPKRDIPMLPESFTRICRYINSPDIEIINETNEIKVYSGKDVAVISEGAIKLSGKKVTTSELSGLYENYNIMGDEKAGFYKKIKDLNESFNDIAYIDFVKHVALNEDANHYVDVFRVKNNIFVTTVDKVNGVSTFYKNVNPIQCRKYINEHMGLNIGEIFEDILPSQETVKKMIVEKRALYEEYIDELHKKKEELDALNSDPETLDADKKAIADALDIVNDEIGKAENDYKDYVSDTDKYLNGDPADADNSIDAESGEYKEDEPTESPEEMSTPIEDEPAAVEDPLADTPVDDAVSVGSEPAIDTTGATDFDGLLDTPAKTEEGEDSYKIVDVRYNYNVKADKTENKGELIVIIPTVDMNGDIRNEMKRITFYLDEEGKPVINNEYMPLDMYKTIINAIVSNPKTAEVIDSMKNGSIAHRSADPAADTNTTEPVAATATLVASVENHDDDPDNDPDNDPNDDTDFDVNDEDFDKFLNDLNLDSDGEPDDEPAAESKAETPAEDSVPVEPVKQESPEDQREAGDAPAYPINVPLNIEDINPISKEDFEGDLDKAGIKHTQSEDNSSDICFTITDKSQVRWLKNYFKEWKGYSDVEFNSFFPELKNCMENKGSVPTMKLESIMLPYTEDYANMFHVNSIEKNPAAIKLIFESAQDKDFTYKSLKKYAKSHELDEDARLFVEKYEADQINESSLIKVPYSSFLHQKMSAMAYPTEVLGESLYITVNGKNAKKASVIFESFYKDEMPASVKSFVNDVKLNENIEITIKDDNGKSVTLNVDDVLNGKKEEKAEGSESPDETFDPDKSFEQVTTFSDDNMSPFGGPKDEDADDEDEKDDEKKDKKDDDKQKNEEEEAKPVEGEEDDEKKEEEKPEEEEKKEEKKPKKHIVIKSKKKNESLEVTDFVDELLTESAKPTVMDNVKLSDGRRGQIIFQMANGDFIVNVAGRTVECAQNSVSMVTPRPDTVECPYKFDPNTLKALYEQYVKCGMFMNGMRMTPDDCKMKYFDYLNTADDDKVTVLVENQKLSIDRKYMRILEDVNNFANIAEYEKLSDKYYYNKKDFSLAESVGNMGKPVRVLADTGDKWELLSVPANTLKS